MKPVSHAHYRRAIRWSFTEKRLLRNLRQAAQMLPPHGLWQLYQDINPRWLLVNADKYRKNAPMLRALSGAAPAFSLNYRMSRRVLFQTDPEVPAAQKTLVVAFTGLLGELMLPLARFTSSFDPKKFDFLIVLSQYKSPYTKGLMGMGGTLNSISRKLTTFVDMDDYARRAAIGTSNGGFPALEFAEMMGFESAVSIGGREYRVGGEFIPSRRVLQSYPQFLCDCTSARAGGTAMTAIFSERDAADRDAAETLRITRPDLAVMPIPGAKDHNPFPSLSARGQVRNFFDEMTQAFEQGRCLRPYRDWAVRKPRAA